MLYLSDYKKYPKVVTNNQTSGLVVIDSLDADMYRTVKYSLSVEDTYTNSIYQCSFTVTHDSLSVYISEFDVINNRNLDLDINADYGSVVSDYPTKVDVTVDFPANFNGNWVLEKEVFINISNIQKSGVDGPSLGLYPSPYNYPS